MNSKDKNPNDVNEAETADADRLSSGRCAVGGQAATGRHHATGQNVSKTRKLWSRDNNVQVLKCYYESLVPGKRGYRKRMYNNWVNSEGFDTTEQRLADQVRNIIKSKWFSELELDEIKKVACSTGSENQESSEEVIDSGVQLGSVLDEDLEQSRSEIGQESESVPSAEDQVLIARILDCRNSLPAKRTRLPSLKHIDKRKLLSETRKINRALKHVQTKDLTEINDTIYSCATVVTNKFVQERPKVQRKRVAPWKFRLQKKIVSMRGDLSKVVECEKRNFNDKLRVTMEKKYNIKIKGFKVVIEELKQRVKAISQKIRRYNNRVNQYHQNKLFSENQSKFYQTLSNPGQIENVTTDKESTKKFWEDIWSDGIEHNKNAPWIGRVKESMKDIEKQNEVVINLENVGRAIRKTPNWKAPGPDGVQGFWLKNLTELHRRITTEMASCLQKGNVPTWMTSGRTVLIMKDQNKGAVPGNYRPITCLPIMWKTMTSVLANEVYEHLEDKNIIGEEQMGCRRNKRGTKDHLVLDKVILRDCKGRKTNLSMTWIDYAKAYDMVPHSWIIETLKIAGVAENTVQIVENSMKMWNTSLECNGEQLGKVNIKRGIFQGDSLSPLLFVIALVPLSCVLRSIRKGYKMKEGRLINHLLFMDDLKIYARSKKEMESLVQSVRLFSDDIRMRFGLAKCATITMKRGKKTEDSGLDMNDGCKIEDIGHGSYKYLGVLEADKIKMQEMKDKVRKEYFKRLRKVLESKLNGGNTVKAINTWAVALVRYSAGIVDWNKEELCKIDRKSRKLMTINRALHPRADIDRLYLPRCEGGRGLISIENCVRVEECSLSDYVRRTNQENTLGMCLTERTAVQEKENFLEEKAQNWKEKPLHGQYVNRIGDTTTKETWQWLINGSIKKETEGLILAAQDQALPTNHQKVKIQGLKGSAMCRMCGQREETVMHIICECSKLAQKEYRKRHDQVCTAVHWKLCKRFDIKVSDKWYDHKAEAVTENENVKILWDFNIQTDRVIEARRPDIVVVDKQLRHTWIIDIAVPGDFRVKEKELEKIEKYGSLAIEIHRMWNTSVNTVPIVIGALGNVHKLTEYAAMLELNKTDINRMQTAALLGTSHILRKVLDIPG